MGVFARLLRRSKATEEASAAETQESTPAAQPEPAAPEAAEAVESAETAGRTEAEPAADGPVEVTADDGPGIPKQQSVQEAADSEAGEGART